MRRDALIARLESQNSSYKKELGRMTEKYESCFRELCKAKQLVFELHDYACKNYTERERCEAVCRSNARSR